MNFESHTKIDATARAEFCAVAGSWGFRIRQSEALAPFTTFKIGGPADLLVSVDGTADLVRLVTLARSLALPVLVLGGGSNVLIADGGVRGLVLLNRCRGIDMAAQPAEEGAHVVCAEAGVLAAGLARTTLRAGLAGLEWAVAVPGTIGGALVGNAGAHGGCIADNLLSAKILDGLGRVTDWSLAEFHYTYRHSRLKRPEDAAACGACVLSATFRLAAADPAELAARAASYVAHRRGTQPTEASVGSMFQNPPGDYAGRLIEEAGLKGTRVGQVQFSPVHANFIVNLGGASASDVLAAVDLARRTVQDRFGITLQPEILLIGDMAVSGGDS